VTGLGFLLAAAIASPSPSASPSPTPVVSAVVDGSDKGDVSKAEEAGGGATEWGAIVVHHSGAAEGSAEAIDHYQRDVLRDPGGIVHHFVIGNGHGSADGAIEVTSAWTRGRMTPHLFHRGALPPAISICLVGDLDAAPPTEAQQTALVNLVTLLAKRYKIPVDRVLTHREVEGRSTSCPGAHFDKLALLERADLLPKGATSVRVTKSTRAVELLRDDATVLRLQPLPEPAARIAALPEGAFPICRKDPASAFGKTLVLGYPDAGAVQTAREAGKIGAADAQRLQTAIAAAKCPPDDTALGGEIGLHAGGTAAASAEDSPCLVFDERDDDLLYDAVPLGAKVEIVP
jgi:hypothetical protein